jgi:hypothetical protein
MISCLLIQVTRNQHGVAVCKESVVSGETIQLGRGAACKIHLLDHRVNLLHATIKHSEDGTLYIDGEKDVTLEINGFISQGAAIPPGTSIEIGPYLLNIENKVDEHDIAISIELTDDHPKQDVACRTAPLSLATLNWSKRKLGYSLAACILFLFMLLPLLPSFSSSLDKVQAALPVTLTESWNPGPLSGGHTIFSAKCSTCHQKAFRGVSDKVCADCHKQVKHHLEADNLHTGKFKNSRCTHCHQDHKGENGLVNHNSAQCVDCHGNIKAVKADTQLADVHDFKSDHPAFHITLRDENQITRVKQDDKAKLIEKSGLKYSHKVHLAKTGVSTPQGDTVMQCKDCHKLEESGNHFAPMTMKKTCQQSGCHFLDFTEPVEGNVPHGSEREVMNRLREFYIKWLTDTPENRKSCHSGSDVRGILACADELARINADTTLFKRHAAPKEKLECGECHEIQPSEDRDVPWKITPLHINRDWQPGATFSHAKHFTMNCTDCHDKMNSKTSEDIAMPGITKCRECHVGNQSVKGMIRSSCEGCHRFHRSEKTAG